MIKAKHNIVSIGGANGPSLVLRGLKNFTELSLSAVIAMSDSGRSSGKIRSEMQQLPPADILRVIISLSKYDYKTLMQIFYSARFTAPSKLDGLNIGSILIALGASYTNDLSEIIKQFSKILEINGTVIPVTYDLVDLIVEYDDHTCMFGEGNIDEPTEINKREIIKAALKPEAKISSEADSAIRAADTIIIGPGDLYTSCIAALLPVGMSEAIEASKAKIIFVAGNKYTIGGEGAPRRLSARTKALEQYLPRPVDVVVYDSHILNKNELKYYKEKKWGLIKFDIENITNKKVIGKDIEKKGGGIDPKKLGSVLLHLI